MHLSRLVLQHFRSYSQETFDFSPETTLIVGPNTAGKTNLVEAIYLLSFGKSFRAEKDFQMIRFEETVARVQGLVTIQDRGFKIQEREERTKLEVMLAQGEVTGGRLSKRFFLNDVAKKRIDFEAALPLVLFSPEELDIVIAGPSLRRRFLDEVLEQVDREYRLACSLYDKALKQRNALLALAKETGQRHLEQFAYWDELLITHGNCITRKREEFLTYVNKQEKSIFPCSAIYNKSVISQERLTQYADAEVGAGVTLVGPHRDDFSLEITGGKNVRYYGSRGQQRLVVLQLKILQIDFMARLLGFRPLLVLDDIFSELDIKNSELVLAMIKEQQTIITTANKELIPYKSFTEMNMIKLGNNTVQMSHV